MVQSASSRLLYCVRPMNERENPPSAGLVSRHTQYTNSLQLQTPAVQQNEKRSLQ